MASLTSMNHAGKLSHFELRGFTDSSLLDADVIAKFIVKNSIGNCIVKCEHELSELVTDENAAVVETMKEFNVTFNATVAELIESYKMKD